MNFEDLKDRIVTDAQATWERLQESSTFNQLRDRYENMSPAMQKISIVGVSALVSLLILSIPYSGYVQSQDYIAEFEGKRSTIRDLLKVSRESSDVPQIQQAPAAGSLQSSIENFMRDAGFLPEQMKGTQITEVPSTLIPRTLTESGVQVSLAKLNLRQIVDFGYQLQSVNPSVKLKDMAITANREDGRYFDVVYKLISLAVPAPPEVPAEEPANSRSRRRGGN